MLISFQTFYSTRKSDPPLGWLATYVLSFFLLLFSCLAAPTIQGTEARADAVAKSSSSTDSSGSDAQANAPSDAGVVIPDTIPTGEKWLDHFKKEILPFYTSTVALGNPVGNFPTWRCNDGSIATKANPCEFKAVGDDDFWIKKDWDEQREFVRTRSRQTFLYGVAYHLTGDEQMLEYHLAGLNWIRTKGLDPKGGAYTYYDTTVTTPDPDPKARSTQDLAYAALSFAMNYYLTRDPAALADVVKLKEYIYKNYWDETLKSLKWKLELGTETKGNRKYELVAALDQINAYMLLIEPLLPDGTVKSTWDADMIRTIEGMLANFHESDLQLFWGEYSSKDEPNKLKDNDHNDFGHTVKSYWQTYLVGRMFAKKEWIDLGRKGAATTLQRAYITKNTVFPDTSTWGGYNYDIPAYMGAWAGQFTGNESTAPKGLKEIYPGSQWWIDAELNQGAAILALDAPTDSTYVGYLSTTYPKFREFRVDEKEYGLYHILERCVPNPPICPADGRKIKFGKGNLWKGGYHEAEHSLVAYVTSQALRHQSVQLYFAWHKNAANKLTRPYLFRGTGVAGAETAFTKHTDYKKVLVTFDDVN